MIKGGLRGQVWIEVVLYTLIGLSIIAVMLAFIKPKIDSSVDKSLLENGIVLLTDIDSVVQEVRYTQGNSRVMNVLLKNGELIFDSSNDDVIFLLEKSNYEYSEPGIDVWIGGTRIKAHTEENSGKYDVALTLSYSGILNTTFNGADKKDSLKKASTPYSLTILNSGNYQLDFDII